MTKSGTPNNRMVCRYCGLESAVSHASTRECIAVLQSEVRRLREHLLHGRLCDTVASQPSELVARRVIQRDGGREWSPSNDGGRSAAIVSLSLLGPNH